MKDRFAAFLVARSRIILILSIICALGCAALIPHVNVNQDMTKYLPKDSSMRQGLDLMEAEFGKEASSELRVMFNDLKTAEEKKQIRKELEQIPYVESVDFKLGDEDYERDGHTLYVINCDYKEFDPEAASVLETVQDSYGETHEIQLGGSIQKSNKTGLPVWIVALAVLMILLILLIMANSYIEPVAFLITIGVAVLINMGTYVLFPSISKTTFGIVAILQMVLSMDYSIMLLNRYRQQRTLTEDKREAMRQAQSLSFGSITGSSLTTFAGLLALLFMSFGIGADIGMALAKGVLISLLCIFTVLPSLLLGFDGLMLRTQKRTMNFDLPKLSGFQYKMRIPLILFFVGLFTVGLLLRGGVGFTYSEVWETPVDDVFGHQNTIVMMYNEKDGKAAGQLADDLEDRGEIRSAVCYESTLGKKRTARDMKDFLEDMQEENDEDTKSSDIDLKLSMVKLIYYDYFAKDDTFRLTIPQFVDYLRNDVMKDEDFGDSIDEDARQKINDMARFTNARTLTTPKGASGLAKFFGMKKSDAKQLLLYYKIKKGSQAGKMTLPGFVSFLIDDVSQDKTYGKEFKGKNLKQLKSMRKYTSKKKMKKKRGYGSAASLLGMKEDQMRLLYINIHAGEGSGSSMTISQLGEVFGAMGEDKALEGRFQGEELAQLTGGLGQIGQMDPGSYQAKDMQAVLDQYGMPLDEETLAFAYAYQDVSQEPDAYKHSTQELVHLMTEDKTISKSMSKKQRSQLNKLKTIIDTSVAGKKLSTKSMSKLLGMKQKDVKSIYILHKYETGQTKGWKLSPKSFIDFLVSDVLKDPKYKSKAGGSAKDLKMAQKLIRNVVAGKAFTADGLADFFAEYSDDMDADQITLLYELYGSEKKYDEAWKMDVVTMVHHLDGSMMDRTSFADVVDEDQKEDVREMRGDLDEAVEKLHGEHYGRMMITADLEEDAEETRAFMADLTARTGRDFEGETYLIGNTPMAYETALSFHKELNKITLITALFIFLIVLLTFRRLTTSVVLVLIIQCAVFVTMDLLSFLHIDMNYLALLIVQSIMMGATIDYAIIYSTYYVENRARLERGEAIRGAYLGSLQTVLTSAIFLIVAAGILSFAFQEPAIREICRILSMGCLVATILIVFLLPAVLSCLDRLVIGRRKSAS